MGQQLVIEIQCASCGSLETHGEVVSLTLIGVKKEVAGVDVLRFPTQHELHACVFFVEQRHRAALLVLIFFEFNLFGRFPTCIER